MSAAERPGLDPHTAPDLEAAALITIDVQRDVVDGGSLEIPGTTEALGAMRPLAVWFRAAGRPIAHLVRLYEPGGGNVDLCRRGAFEAGLRALVAGSEGSQLAAGLVPEPGAALDHELLLGGGIQRVGADEAVIYKPRWGAFYESALEGFLQEREVSTLVFCGANFPNCPRASIYQASERDFRVLIARDAISGLDPRGEEELRRIGVHAMSSAEIVRGLAALSSARRQPPDQPSIAP